MVGTPNYFSPTRSTKQGCPLSPYLFILSYELLANDIRNNNRIKGITINGVEHKLVQYADDLTLFVSWDPVSLQEIERAFDRFYRFSGLKVNYHKSCIYRLGPFRGTDVTLPSVQPFQWVNEFKMLGIYISDKNVLENNFEIMLEKATAMCTDWENKRLSLLGKILIINTLVALQFAYRLAVMESIPKKLVEKYNKLIRNFIWNKGKPRIALKVLQTHRSIGGMGLINLEIKDTASKIQWIG